MRLHFTGSSLFIRCESGTSASGLAAALVPSRVMFRRVFVRVLTSNDRIRRRGVKAEVLRSAVAPHRQFSGADDEAFDPTLLRFLVCPLSKKPLR